MYFPYFRGKQYELITIRESAVLLADAGFVPIIEPVKESLGGLQKTLKAIRDSHGRAIVIVNPYHGDHREDGAGITQLLADYLGDDSISAGILLRSDISADEASACYDNHRAHNPTLVHAGFTSPKSIADHLGQNLANSRNVFVEDHAKILYRKHFEGSARILVRDGFKRQKNADYPPLEPFSDLHVTYEEMNMTGFGDFLTVGDAYSESGGPAYAVAIHLTFIDADRDGEMFIYHFVSDTNNTPADPAGKFGQALAKLIKRWDSGTSKLHNTSAIGEFRELHAKGHFPGLGYVKKLSMKHHIETLAHYLG
ncbi:MULTISPECIES: sce7725 family protein [Asticcacaulis]|uniref:sce7725 family protein n=1 Tax=Asticcacaulis TaxID=76890 RepID=UPI001AE46634|nr:MULTISPECIES: sce7725 family protein [Asticcacaulis]MBP2161281.1 hypothetical protein [Asticcacaulis solisilvae]MDR6802353.1 hypothetical protein [Asticcacaulis sp. BE141]